MNRKETVERIKIMQAFVDGKQIQYKDDGRWKDVKDPMWSSINEYRIKPEPKYRPFKDVEECWQEMQKHQPFGWLKHKTDNVYSFISKIDKDCCYFAVNVYWGFDTLFKTKTFIDGTPFGIKEE